MKFDHFARLFAGAILMTSTFATPAPALAQVIKGGAIAVPCCKCIGGQGNVVNFTSGSGAGSVPFNVIGPGVSNPVAQTITTNINPLWTATLAPAQWIHANDNNGGSLQPGGSYRYSVRIVIPKCTIPMKVTLTGNAAADDQVKVFLNGSPIGATPTNAISSPPPVPTLAAGWGFRAERIAPFSWTTNIPGTYVLRFDVVNGSTGPTGLLVNAALRTDCTTKLQVD
jgi:hypothetical protein